MIRRPITLEEAEAANAAWGCNCGPGALAAIMGMSLDEVRPHVRDFDRRRYTNPTMMFDALDSVGAKWKGYGRRCDWPVYGLCRIQWEGPWTQPGVPPRAAYRHTHWIAVQHPAHSSDVGIFDINCCNNGTGWVSESDWRDIVVPHLLRGCVPRANGAWHITHSIEIDPNTARPASSDS